VSSATFPIVIVALFATRCPGVQGGGPACVRRAFRLKALCRSDDVAQTARASRIPHIARTSTRGNVVANPRHRRRGAVQLELSTDRRLGVAEAVADLPYPTRQLLPHEDAHIGRREPNAVGIEIDVANRTPSALKYTTSHSASGQNRRSPGGIRCSAASVSRALTVTRSTAFPAPPLAGQRTTESGIGSGSGQQQLDIASSVSALECTPESSHHEDPVTATGDRLESSPNA
jgi:hypothetical protein